MQGHKMHVKWSQQVAEFQSKGRLFDRIIQSAQANEAREYERLQQVDALAHQRKRGTREDTISEHSHQNRSQRLNVPAAKQHQKSHQSVNKSMQVKSSAMEVSTKSN